MRGTGLHAEEKVALQLHCGIVIIYKIIVVFG